MSSPGHCLPGGVDMSIEKINSVLDVVNVNAKMNAGIARRRTDETENRNNDVVSIGGTEEASSVGEIRWPPFFPIGDAQSIFKIEK